MDHYAPTHDLAHHWRTRTLIATGVATIELLALVALGVVLLGRGWFQQARASATKTATHHHVTAPAATTGPSHTRVARLESTPHAVVPARPLLARAHTEVLVLNGNGQNGAAGTEARALRAHGYPVAAVGNAKRNDYAASMVMYRPGYEREASRMARDAGITVVTALDGLLPSQLKSAELVLIVGK